MQQGNLARVEHPILCFVSSQGIDIQRKSRELGEEEVVVVAEVAQGRSGEVPIRTQLVDHSVAELRQGRVTVMTTYGIVGITSMLHKRENGVETRAGGAKDA